MSLPSCRVKYKNIFFKLNYNKTTNPSFFGEFRVSAHGMTGSELYTTSEAAIIHVA